MNLPYWLISRLPHSWKWVRKNLGGKWRCYYWMGDFMYSENHDLTPCFWVQEPIAHRDQLWVGNPRFDEDYTESVPMLPQPTEMTGYRG